jgi:hypothetical protein
MLLEAVTGWTHSNEPAIEGMVVNSINDERIQFPCCMGYKY